MKSLTESGFAVIEGLLLLVVVAIIGGTGFYVYKGQQNSNKSVDSTSTPLKTQTNASKKSAEPVKKTESANSQHTYSFAGKTVTYAAPKDWTVEEKADGNSVGDKWWTITLKSADYKDYSGDQMMCGQPEGQYISLTFSPSTKTNQEVTDNVASSNDGIKSQKTTQISGQKAVTFVWNPGECSDRTKTVGLAEGYEISVENMPFSTQTNAMYDQILASIVLK